MRLRAFSAALFGLGLAAACDGVSRDPEAHFRGQGGETTGGAATGDGQSTGGSAPRPSGGSDATSGGSAGELQAGEGGEPSATGGVTSTGGAAGAGAEAGSAGAAMDGGAAGASAGGSTGGGSTGGSTASGGSAGSGNSAGAGNSDAISRDGLVYWFSGDDLVGVNGAIAEWRDRSGNEAHAVQPVPESRPKFGVFPYADRPAAIFTAPAHLVLPPLTANFDAGVTFFAVVRADPGWRCLPLLELSNGTETDDLNFLGFNQEFTYEVVEEYANAIGGTFGSGSILMLDVTHAPSGDVTISANGLVSTTDSFPLPANVTRDQVFLSRSLYEECAGNSWEGEVAELLLYSRLLDTSEREQVRSYLAEKWKCCVPR